MTRHGRLRFAPGTRSSYSSLGYLLLGCLIERVSGSTYEDVVSAGILRPLGMARTAFAYPPDSVDDVGRGHERAGSATGLIGRFVFRRFVAHRAGPYLEFRPFLVDAPLRWPGGIGRGCRPIPGRASRARLARWTADPRGALRSRDAGAGSRPRWTAARARPALEARRHRRAGLVSRRAGGRPLCLPLRGRRRFPEPGPHLSGSW